MIESSCKMTLIPFFWSTSSLFPMGSFLLCALVCTVSFDKVNAKQRLRTWNGPDQFISGSVPIKRDSFGFAASSGNFYLFGGFSYTGGALEHMNLNSTAVSFHRLRLPQVFSVTSTDSIRGHSNGPT